MNKQRKCRFCGTDFIPTHGNRWYCCEAHKQSQKAESQYKLYNFLKEFRKGYLNNFKIFEQILPLPGKQTFPLPEIRALGFSQDCYYKVFRDTEQKNWYKVGPYRFTIIQQNQHLAITIVNQ